MVKTPRKPRKANRDSERRKAAKKHQEALEFARRSFRKYAEAYKALAKH
jgi:hypothetical protein